MLWKIAWNLKTLALSFRLCNTPAYQNKSPLLWFPEVLILFTSVWRNKIVWTFLHSAFSKNYLHCICELSSQSMPFPSYPCAHLQLYPPGWFTHFKFCPVHKWRLGSLHSSMSENDNIIIRYWDRAWSLYWKNIGRRDLFTKLNSTVHELIVVGTRISFFRVCLCHSLNNTSSSSLPLLQMRLCPCILPFSASNPNSHTQ